MSTVPVFDRNKMLTKFPLISQKKRPSTAPVENVYRGSVNIEIFSKKNE